MAKKLWNWSLRIHLLRVHIFTVIQWLPTWYIQMYTVQWGCWLLTPLEWVAGLGMGTSTARGARFPVPNRSYPAEREPARSSPIHPIARLSGSERLRRSTAKILLALLYVFPGLAKGVVVLTFDVLFDVSLNTTNCLKILNGQWFGTTGCSLSCYLTDMVIHPDYWCKNGGGLVQVVIWNSCMTLLYHHRHVGKRKVLELKLL